MSPLEETVVTRPHDAPAKSIPSTFNIRWHIDGGQTPSLSLGPSLFSQIDSKAKNDDKYPEAVAGLMKEPGMTK